MQSNKIKLTKSHYLAMVLAIHHAGIDDAVVHYRKIFGNLVEGVGETYIKNCAELDFIEDTSYQGLINQAQTNEWGAGVTITKHEAIQVLQLELDGKLPVGYDVMCKEYGEDDDWVGMTGEDDLELLKDDSENHYQTFVLTTNETESFWVKEVKALSITMNLTGKTEQDIYDALDAAVLSIKEGHSNGHVVKDNTSFEFNAALSMTES